MRVSLCVFIFNLRMTIYLRLPILYFPIGYGVSLYSLLPLVVSLRIHDAFRWTCTKAIRMFLWSRSGSFEKSATNIQNGMFFRTLRTHCTPSIFCVSWAVCILPIVIRPDFDVTTTSSGSVSAGVVMSLTTQIVACSFCSCIDRSCKYFVVILALVPLLCVPLVPNAQVLPCDP